MNFFMPFYERVLCDDTAIIPHVYYVDENAQ